MKKMIGTILLFSFMIFCFGSSLQAGPIEGNIGSLRVDDNTYVFFDLINGSGADNGCNSDSFILDPAFIRFDEIYRLLLLAKSHNFRVVAGISACLDNNVYGNLISITLK